jgi:hypothetical protein
VTIQTTHELEAEVSFVASQVGYNKKHTPYVSCNVGTGELCSLTITITAMKLNNATDEICSMHGSGREMCTLVRKPEKVKSL